MGIIFSNDFIDVGDSEITARSEATGYDKLNVMDQAHLKRRFRADDVTQSDSNYLIKFDLGSAQTVVALFVNDINFNKISIRGHASDLGTDWSTADYDSGDVSVSLDVRVNRYKVYIPLTAFNYRWLAIQVPSAASAVGSYTTKWEIGTVCILDSVTELSKNMSYGYTREAALPYMDIPIKSGTVERISLNDNLKWKGTLYFGNRSLSDETELWTMNRIDLADSLIFYENAGSTQYCYLCLRDSAYSGRYGGPDYVSGNTIQLSERV